jgi:hypothetical protein
MMTRLTPSRIPVSGLPGLAWGTVPYDALWGFGLGETHLQFAGAAIPSRPNISLLRMLYLFTAIWALINYLAALVSCVASSVHLELGSQWHLAPPASSGLFPGSKQASK